jgi:hypothetical protein
VAVVGPAGGLLDVFEDELQPTAMAVLRRPAASRNPNLGCPVIGSSLSRRAKSSREWVALVRYQVSGFRLVVGSGSVSAWLLL